MNQLLTLFLPLLFLYGYPILILVILAGAVGLPVPVTLIMIVAGSLTTTKTLTLILLIPIATIAAVMGDCLGYWVGKTCEPYITSSSFRRLGLTEGKITSLHHFLEKWGVWFIFFSRWLITPFGIPLNVVAGIGDYPFMKFLLFAALGEALWAFLYGYLGYLFGANWPLLIPYITKLSWILALLGGGLLFLIIAFRMKKHIKRT